MLTMIEYFHGYPLIKGLSIQQQQETNNNNTLPEIEKLGASRIYTNKRFCSCRSEKEGIINVDVSAHEHDCQLRKRLFAKGYVLETSVLPEPEDIDNGLGVAK
jgi:hypothetical protein